MKPIEIAREIVETKTCHLVRPRKDEPGEYDAKPYDTGSKRGWTYLDLFSASAVVQVYDALGPANRAKYAAMPIAAMVPLAFKMIERANGGAR